MKVLRFLQKWNAEALMLEIWVSRGKVMVTRPDSVKRAVSIDVTVEGKVIDFKFRQNWKTPNWRVKAEEGSFSPNDGDVLASKAIECIFEL